ncbi:hypothetical protein FOE78_01540 [Microlunatus elymi]|uniref:DUF3566 domain-containing protein n=1 Tax=Microlunatus elymi TaxID=2596828 RepID=A0A516PUE5_9ACTN|nr:DUF3566 domain-containing protein [Microlunatus elymi]QDP94772.1 hypothetical protein FOE78_01540 [Microlunatus elymi]
MSERSRGPETASGPATTDRSSSSAAGGDDIYAAAAASQAGRTRRNGSPANGSGANGTAVNGGSAPSSKQSSAKQEPAKQSGAKQSGAKPSTAKQEPPTKPASAGAKSNAKPEAKSGAQAGAPVNKAQSAAGPAPAQKPTSKIASVTTGALAGEKAAEAKQQDGGAAAEQTAVIQQDSVVPTKKAKPKAGTARGTRTARLRLSRLDPWSVMKTSFLFSIAAGIVMVVAVYAVWLVIGSSGLFSSLDSIVGSVLQSPGDTTPFRIEDYVNTQKVMGVTAFLACIDVVIFTALATLASFLYNLAATMLGGLEVTLAED